MSCNTNTIGIVYPDGVESMQEKLDFLATVREALRRDHNTHGQAFENNEITQAEWESYVMWNAARSEAACAEYCSVLSGHRGTFRDLPDNAPELDVDFTTVFSEEGA